MEVKEKPKYPFYTINSDIEKALRDGEVSIDFNKPETNIPLAQRMLTFPWRGYVIYKIKAPLQRAIQSATRLVQVIPALLEAAGKMRVKFGSIEDALTLDPNTQCLKEHKARFLSYESNPSREPLFSSTYDIAIVENEHDNYYRFRLGAEVEWIVEDILAGKWEPRFEGYPDKCWNEPAPYGGKYSIVYKLQKHRKEILKLIEEE